MTLKREEELEDETYRLEDEIIHLGTVLGRLLEALEHTDHGTSWCKLEPGCYVCKALREIGSVG